MWMSDITDITFFFCLTGALFSLSSPQRENIRTYPWDYLEELLTLQRSCLGQAKHDGRLGVLSTRGGTCSFTALSALCLY